MRTRVLAGAAFLAGLVAGGLLMGGGFALTGDAPGERPAGAPRLAPGLEVLVENQGSAHMTVLVEVKDAAGGFVFEDRFDVGPRSVGRRALVNLPEGSYVLTVAPEGGEVERQAFDAEDCPGGTRATFRYGGGASGWTFRGAYVACR